MLAGSTPLFLLHEFGSQGISQMPLFSFYSTSSPTHQPLVAVKLSTVWAPQFIERKGLHKSMSMGSADEGMRSVRTGRL